MTEPSAEGTAAPRTSGPSAPWAGPASIAILVALMGFLFRDGLALMWLNWEEPEYNHGYLIPFIALYLLALRARDLAAAREPGGSWAGTVLLLASLAMLMLGELSAVYVITQYGFVLTLWAIAWAAFGTRGVVAIWPALLYLVFMIPLPKFLQFNLSAQLQLISSQLGVVVIRAFAIPVHVEGNVIDLGIYQLQVADACSGLRYLFPLMSFGFLCAALFRAPWWQRTIVFLSTIPITVLMNSFRVGVIGVLVDHWGIAQAEGFLHYFEGWVVFMACVGILFLEMYLFARLLGKPLGEVFAVDVPPLGDLTGAIGTQRVTRPLASCAALLLAGALAMVFVGRPVELAPERASLRTFPQSLQDWRGSEQTVAQVYLDELKTTDYLAASYVRPETPPVDLWVAYYDSQRKGASVHSPRACLPGGGWQIESFTEHRIDNVGPAGEPLAVNRVLMSMGNNRALVYYWFVQQGRLLTNEFAVKWFIFWDALTRNRTDGALVRLVIPVSEGYAVEDGDRTLEDFARAINPPLHYHLPPEQAVLRPVASARGE